MSVRWKLWDIPDRMMGRTSKTDRFWALLSILKKKFMLFWAILLRNFYWNFEQYQCDIEWWLKSLQFCRVNLPHDAGYKCVWKTKGWAAWKKHEGACCVPASWLYLTWNVFIGHARCHHFLSLKENHLQQCTLVWHMFFMCLTLIVIQYCTTTSSI